MNIAPSSILSSVTLRAFLVTNPVNIRYLTGLEVSDGKLLVTARNFHLFVDGRYLESAKKKEDTTLRVHSHTLFEKAVAKLPECGFESDKVVVAVLSYWKRKYPNTKFVQKKGVIEEFRRGKTASQLRLFKRAQSITQEVLQRVPAMLRRKISEKDLAWQLQVWAQELGADELSFDPIVAFGTNTSHPHHHPGDRMLKRGNLVQVDVGARYKRYCADQSAVFFTRPPTPLQRRVHTALEEALLAAKNAIEPGVTNTALDTIARGVLEEYDLEQYFTHALGHGVGLEIHEGVSLSVKATKKKLLRNEIVTIEPGVYIPGKFGMRLEEEVIIR